MNWQQKDAAPKCENTHILTWDGAGYDRCKAAGVADGFFYEIAVWSDVEQGWLSCPENYGKVEFTLWTPLSGQPS